MRSWRDAKLSTGAALPLPYEEEETRDSARRCQPYGNESQLLQMSTCYFLMTQPQSAVVTSRHGKEHFRSERNSWDVSFHPVTGLLRMKMCRQNGPALEGANSATKGLALLDGLASTFTKPNNEFVTTRVHPNFPDLPPGARTANGTALCH